MRRACKSNDNSSTQKNGSLSYNNIKRLRQFKNDNTNSFNNEDVVVLDISDDECDVVNLRESDVNYSNYNSSKMKCESKIQKDLSENDLSSAKDSKGPTEFADSASLDDIEKWSPMKNFSLISDLLNKGGDIARRVDYIVNQFGKAQGSFDEVQANRDSSKIGRSLSTSSKGRGRGRGRGSFNKKTY